MVNNLADALIVIEEQAQTIERLRASAHNSDYVKCSACGMPLNSSCDCVNKDCMVYKYFT